MTRRVTLLSLNSCSDFHWKGKGRSFFTFVSYFKNKVEYVIRVNFINTASKKWSITLIDFDPAIAVSSGMDVVHPSLPKVSKYGSLSVY